jgi:hypothetical protein
MTGRDGARRTVLALALGAEALLPGCSLLHRSRPPLACPRTAIINELASLDHYRSGAPQQPENLAYRTVLQNLNGTCTAAGQDVNVNVSVEVVVEPGPAFEGTSVDVPYLVSVLGPGGAVLDRKDFTAKVTVAPGARRGGTRESFAQRFVGIGPAKGSAYQVLFGLAPPAGDAERLAPAG